MKKSNILIAVFAIVAGASMAKAQDVKVSFDGRSAGSVSFAALLEASVPEQNNKMPPVPEPRAAFYVDKSPIGFGVAEIDERITYDIAAAKKAGAERIAASLERLLKAGTAEEKYSCAFPGKKYRLPEKYTAPERAVRFGEEETWEYGDWEEEETLSESVQIDAGEICRYVTKRFCRLACRIVHGVGGDDYKDCRRECKNIIEKACDELDAKP